MVELDNVQAVQAASYFLGIMHTNDNYEYGSIMCQASLYTSTNTLSQFVRKTSHYLLNFYFLARRSQTATALETSHNGHVHVKKPVPKTSGLNWWLVKIKKLVRKN